MDGQQRALFELQRDWAITQREEAKKALAFYDRVGARFIANNVDITEEQKASTRGIIENMTTLIDGIEVYLA